MLLFHRTKQKFVCIIMSALLLIVVCVQASTSSITSDGENVIWDEAVAVLSALDILIDYGDEEFKPDEAITRAEFSALVIRALGLEGISSSEVENLWQDVNTEHWAYNDIQIAGYLGLISGYEDGMFRPDELITYEQAVKILVHAIGYTPYAEEKGGYPSGYMLVAFEKGITKKTGSYVGKPLIRGIATHLIHQAMEVDLMNTIPSENIVIYEITRGKNLLSEVFKVEKIRGIVTGDSFTNLNGFNPLNEGEIAIDGIVYLVGKAMEQSYLGYYVTAYIKEEPEQNDRRVLVAIYADASRNQLITVNSEDSPTISENKTELYYYSGNDSTHKKTAVLSPIIDIVYNGSTYFGKDINTIIPSYGYVTLLDNSEDGIFDVAFVNDYKNFVVNGVSLEDEMLRIFDKYSNDIFSVDLADKKTLLSITKEGKKIAGKDIKNGDVLSIAGSLDGRVNNIIVSNEMVKGTVTELSQGKITIGDVTYKRAFNFLEDKTNIPVINVGDESEFYIDAFGNIAGVSSVNRSKNYGFLVYATVLSKGIDTDRAQFKIFTTDGKMVNLISAHSIMFNNKTRDESGNKYTGASIINSGLFTDTSGNFRSQLITYSTNSKGEINRINTAVSPRNAVTNNDLVLNDSFVDQRWSTDTKTMAGRYIFDDSTIIFMVPKVENGRDIQERDLAVVRNGVLIDTYYSSEIYDANEVKIPKAAVVIKKESGQGQSVNTNIFLVDKISSIMTEGDMILTKRLYGITGGYNTSSKEYYDAKEPEVLDGLHQGDIIQISVNNAGEVDYVKKLFSVIVPPNKLPNVLYSDQPGLVYFSGNNFAAQDMMIYGIVVAKSGNIITVTVDNGETEGVHMITLDKKIYVYDKEKGKVSIGTLNDIVPSSSKNSLDGSKVFMYKKYNVTREIVVMKGL